MRRRISAIVPIIVLLTSLFAIAAHAQDDTDDGGQGMLISPAERLALQALRPRIGLFGHLALNFHTGSFAGLPEVPSCLPNDSALFGGDMGLGFAAGLLFEMPLSSKWFFEARAGYAATGARLTTDAYIGPILVGSEDTASGISEYSLDASLGMVSAELTMGWRPIAAPLTVRLGPDVGIFLGKSFTQQEELKEPSSAAFIAADGSATRIRNAASGDIANTALQIGATLGADYELPMNAERTLLLVPEIRYSFPFTKVRSDVDWRIHRLRGGLALKYSFPLPKPEPPMPPTTEPVEPPAPPAQPMLAATLELAGVTRAGEEQEVLKITVEEFINTQTHALLNYIFFDEGSSTVPARYAQYGGDASGQFSFDMLRDQGTLAVYHQILNIIGTRMKADPAATITLTGTNMNEGIEEGNKELSRSRAESVKSYLTSSWGIEPRRITVKERNLPQLPSNPEEADGDQENRRVEITSNRPTLLEPVTTDDTLRTVDPPTIRAIAGFTADAGIADWSLQIRQGSDLLKEFSGEGEIPENLDWNIEGDPQTIPRRQQPVTALLSVRDEEGQTGSAAARLPVEQITIRRKREERLGDFVYDRFSLITFEFNSAKLPPPSKKIAADIRERIRPESEVDIVGYSDRLGEEAHNLELSTDRAVNTARELRVPVENARGGGENTTLYDNDLPEGRFYSRTVAITIKTPVNQ